LAVSEHFGQINITWTPFCVVHRKEFSDDDFNSAYSIGDWLFATRRSTHSLTNSDRRRESTTISASFRMPIPTVKGDFLAAAQIEIGAYSSES
jgi:hypothetical protein